VVVTIRSSDKPRPGRLRRLCSPVARFTGTLSWDNCCDDNGQPPSRPGDARIIVIILRFPHRINRAGSGPGRGRRHCSPACGGCPGPAGAERESAAPLPANPAQSPMFTAGEARRCLPLRGHGDLACRTSAITLVWGRWHVSYRHPELQGGGHDAVGAHARLAALGRSGGMCMRALTW